MLGQLPPYALSIPVFRFRALAQHAGRAALGGDREIALACFAIARLGAGMLPPFMLAPADAAGRVANTKQWVASLALSAVARTAAASAIDAVGNGDRKTAGHAIARLGELAAKQLDQASVAEIRELTDELART